MEDRKTALVTGSARRLGKHIAQRLIEQGWEVVIHARSASSAAETAEELGAAGSVGADLSDSGAAKLLVSEALPLLGGKLHLLVNSAGTFVRTRPSSTSVDDWHHAMDINALAPLILTQTAIPQLQQANGLVFNIVDRAATEHWMEFAAHSAAKAALASLTYTCAKELQPLGVRVNGVSPNTVLPPDEMPAEKLAAIKAVPGAVGTPDDVTDVLFAFLASPNRTGEIISL